MAINRLAFQVNKRSNGSQWNQRRKWWRDVTAICEQYNNKMKPNHMRKVINELIQKTEISSNEKQTFNATYSFVCSVESALREPHFHMYVHAKQKKTREPNANRHETQLKSSYD